MSWDVMGFLHECGIPYERQRGDWANVRCPHCGDHGFHGGFNILEGYYHCWKCGSKHLNVVVGALLGLGRSRASEMVEKYRRYVSSAGSVRKALNATTFKLAGGPMSVHHKKYLEKRGFDPDHLESQYGLQGTGPSESAYGMDYGLRIVIPLHDINGQIIGCQGRDITGKHKLRYIGSPLEKSLMDYKNTLYASHLVRGDTVFVVEGVFDAMRLGAGFVASYGTAMSKAQLKMLSKHWKNVGFIFDPEPVAQEKAREYARLLSGLGVSVELITLDTDGRDPAELTPAEAREVRNGLGLKY